MSRPRRTSPSTLTVANQPVWTLKAVLPESKPKPVSFLSLEGIALMAEIKELYAPLATAHWGKRDE